MQSTTLENNKQKSSITKRISLQITHISLPLAMILLSVVTALSTGMDDAEFIAAFNKGYGLNMGYFTIILLCSFFLAAAISKGGAFSLGRLSAVVSPFTGAAMVCPDTSYATLSPIARDFRSYISVGSYAGFKLLVPAGPLIIGVALSVDVGKPGFILLGIALMIPTVIAGLFWLMFMGKLNPVKNSSDSIAQSDITPTLFQVIRRLFPLLCLAILLLIGFTLDLTTKPILKFFTSPVGALIATSILTYGLIAPELRRECLESTMRRTAPLLLVIGSATALGVILAKALSLGEISTFFHDKHSSLVLVVILFGVAALFKVINGSSLATFAAVPPILSPVIAGSLIDPNIAVYAICLGSFIAVLPNDSYFWLTQPNEAAASGQSKPDFTFTGVSIVQGLVGLLCLCAYMIITRNV
jgi:GntP family gluconate:H+ symporter